MIVIKLPNSYGGVIHLAGRRRKKYAVRVSAGYKRRICIPNKAEYLYLTDKYAFSFRKSKNDYVIYCENDEVKSYLDEVNVPYRLEFVRQYQYLGFFERSKDAYAYLAKYNADDSELKKHTSLASEPLFKDVYRQYIEFVQSLNKPPSEASMRSYGTGYKLWSDVHDLRFRSISTKQLQDCLTAHGTMSKASVTRMLTILKKMYKYAIAHQITDTDLTPFLFAEYSEDKVYAHEVYTDEEIALLWDHVEYEGARVMLILIYSGMRCSEFLEMKTEDVHLDERYMVGGIKTKAGKNRIIPIHKKIAPLIESLYNADNKYLFPTKDGRCYPYQHFREKKWVRYTAELKISHRSHDCRHTFATLMERYDVPELHRKLILGHTIRDITLGIYTHISKEDLIKSIDLIEPEP